MLLPGLLPRDRLKDNQPIYQARDHCAARRALARDLGS
jgi:hypothetical protein